EQELRVQLVEAFYGAMVADEYVEVTGDALDQAQRHLDQVQLMFNEGVVSEYDRIRARVAVSNMRPDLIEAETARELAYKGLKNLLGMDLDTPITLQGEISDIIQQPELGYAAAADYATERRLELKQLDLQRKLYEDQKLIEQRNWLWPNVLAGLRWETQAQSNEFDFQDQRFYNGTSAQLMVNIPLFNGLASHRRSQIAEVNIRKMGLQHDMFERGIRMQVFQATQSYEKASETLQASLENRGEAEKGYNLAETRYAEGIGTQLEVLDAQLQLNMSKVNVLQAEYDQLIARAQYDRALGQVQ
ncbi:MAG TPA: TolC family protein, partial [Bacteroidetes bacterium]|nr:TolC family protein [Bacteroidota bacterium]HEX04853.1 TolC family protein [Bacteroidota bacterium]